MATALLLLCRFSASVAFPQSAYAIVYLWVGLQCKWSQNFAKSACTCLVYQVGCPFLGSSREWQSIIDKSHSLVAKVHISDNPKYSLESIRQDPLGKVTWDSKDTSPFLG